MNFDIETINILVENIDDLDLLKKVMQKDKYILTILSQIFEEKVKEAYSLKNITDEELYLYIEKAITCSDRDITMDIASLLTNLHIIMNSTKEEIVNMISSKLKSNKNKKYIEEKRKESPLFNYDDINNPNCEQVPLIDIGVLKNIEQNFGLIYRNRLIEAKKNMSDIINRDITVSDNYKRKMLAQISNIYNLDVLYNLERTYLNAKLMNNLNEKEKYMVVISLSNGNTTFFSKRFFKVLNSDLVLATRNFKDIANILEEIYNTSNDNKIMPEVILLNEKILKYRTGDEALEIYKKICSCKNYDEANIVKNLGVQQLLENISFENQMEQLNYALKAESLDRKKYIVYFFTQTSYAENVSYDIKKEIATKILQFEDDYLAESYASYMVQILRNKNFSQNDMLALSKEIKLDDTCIEAEYKYEILNHCTGYDSNMSFREIIELLNCDKSSNNYYVNICQQYLLLMKKIKEAQNIDDLRKSVSKTK